MARHTIDYQVIISTKDVCKTKKSEDISSDHDWDTGSMQKVVGKS